MLLRNRCFFRPRSSIRKRARKQQQSWPCKSRQYKLRADPHRELVRRSPAPRRGLAHAVIKDHSSMSPLYVQALVPSRSCYLSGRYLLNILV